MARQRAVREGKALGRLGWNYLFCIQVQFLNNRDKTRVLADTVISCMLHFVKHIVALRMLGELMEFLAYFGIRNFTGEERKRWSAALPLSKNYMTSVIAVCGGFLRLPNSACLLPPYRI